MATMRVAAATWEFIGADGQRHRAFFGDVVDLHEDEVARGLALGIIQEPLAEGEPAAEAGDSGGVYPGAGGGGGGADLTGGQGANDSGGGEPTPPDTGGQASTATEDRPPAKAANLPVWKAYAIKVGAVTEAEAEEMTKAALQDAVARKAGG